MATRGAARINLIADATGVRRGTREAEREISRLSQAGARSFSVLKTGALAAGAAIGTTLAVGVRTGWQELQEAEAASAKLNAVLASTKGAAGLTRAELDRMNESLQRQSTLEGDVIQNAQALLLTFTNIGEKTFPAATRAAVDMARVFDMDVNRAAVQLGKALQDPVKGVAALQRVGISFTQQQREQIKAMVEAGQVGKAQAIVLAELNRQVGGAEQAYGRSLPGAIDKAKRAYKDFTEDAVRRAIEYWPKVQETVEAVVNRLRVVWNRHADDVRRALDAIRGFVRDQFGWLRDYGDETTRALNEGSRAWEAHGGTIRKVTRYAGPLLEEFVGAITNHMQIVIALVNGDWRRAGSLLLDYFIRPWRLLKTVVERAAPDIVGAVARLAKRVPEVMRGQINEVPGILRDALVRMVRLAANAVVNASAELGKAIPHAIAAGIASTGSVVGRAITRIVPDSLNPLDLVRRADGGFIPGQYRGRDDRLALVASGEAVLTPRQQAMIPGGRGTLQRIFQATGGVVRGGRGFAAGGWVNPVPGGSWRYGPGGGTHSRRENGYVWQDDDAWDIMGGDGTPVYAANAGRVSATRPFSRDPRYWGHGLYLDVAGGQFFYKHLKTLKVSAGQRVAAGQLLGTLGAGVNGGPHLHLGANPISLLERARGGGRPGAGGRGGEPDEGGGVDEGRPAPARRLTAALLRSLRSGGVAPAPSGQDRISGRDSDDQVVERRAGDAAVSMARGKGVTNPEKLTALREQAVNTERAKDLLADKRDLLGELQKVRALWARLHRLWGEAYRRLRKARTQAAQNREIAAIRALNEQKVEAKQEERALIRQLTDVGHELDLLGMEQADIDAEIRRLPDTETSEAATGGVDATAPGGLSPEQGRTIRRGEVAANENILLREFIGAAFGPGDIGAGGVGAVGAATGGRWVPIHVDAGSLSAAVGSSIGTGGYVSASFVPSGA